MLPFIVTYNSARPQLVLTSQTPWQSLNNHWTRQLASHQYRLYLQRDK